MDGLEFDLNADRFCLLDYAQRICCLRIELKDISRPLVDTLSECHGLKLGSI